MTEEFQKVTFLMLTFILIILALLPLLGTIEGGFTTIDTYYEQYSN